MPSVAKAYGFRDDNALPGTGHYRLRMVDRSGASDYSQVVTVGLRATSTKGVATEQPDLNAASVFPNPLSGGEALQLQYHLEAAGELTLTLFDGSGKALHTRKVRSEAGSRTLSLDLLSQAPAGLYVLHVAYGSEVRIYKVVKRN